MSLTDNFVRSRFQWPDELVDRFRQLWSDPAMSASKIALRLGMTRSAVLGKRKRMGLPERGSGVRVPASGDSLRPSKRSRARRGEGAGQTKPHWRPSLPDCEATAAVDLPPESSDCAVTILGLTEQTCRWPIGEAAAAMTYCGATALDESSYCGRHHRLAHKRAA